MFSRGELVKNWGIPETPMPKNHYGRFVCLEPLQANHLKPLYMALIESPDYDWHYTPFDQFASLKSFEKQFSPYICETDPMFFAIRRLKTEEILGYLSFLNIKAECGSIEIGYIQFSLNFQRTTGATEAIFLLIKHAFELGYRRVEWKCDSLNKRSRKAAERLGFKFEGVFRQALVVKGRNRDTAWYSIIDKEWKELSNIFDYWFERTACSETYISLSKLIKDMEAN